MIDRRSQFSRRGLFGRAAAVAAGGLAASRTARAAEPKAEPKRMKKKPEPRWQIGCYTRPWDKHEVRVALDAIAEAGYRYVGLMTTKSKTRLVISVATTLEEARRVGAECKKRGLKIPSVYGGGIPVHQSLAAGITDNCAAAGAGDLLMGGIGEKKLVGAYYKAVAECCDYAAAKSVGISVKPHGGLNATGPQCRKLIESVGHKNFRIWYDPGNIYYYSNGQRDPVADAATVDGLVVGMSVKDDRHPKDVMVPPGAGQVDFAKVLARLRKGGFTSGPLVVETLARGDLKATLAEAVKARKFLEQLTAGKSR